MSSIHNGHAIFDESNAPAEISVPENGSNDLSPTTNSGAGPHDEVLEVSSEAAEDKQFPIDPLDLQSFSKRQMDVLHDQMNRYKSMNHRFMPSMVQGADGAMKVTDPVDGKAATSALPSTELIYLQRRIRADIISKRPEWGKRYYTSQNDTAVVKLQPADTFYRSRKQNKREWKLLEKDLKKKRAEKDEARRKATGAFTRAVMMHREDFIRFHRSKRITCGRTAKAVKVWLETMESRREKRDNRAEARRLQALRENNMEAYIELVQETKNSRLKYLLTQTDEYISIINRMVKDQRGKEPAARGRKKKKPTVAAGAAAVEADDEESNCERAQHNDDSDAEQELEQEGDIKEDVGAEATFSDARPETPRDHTTGETAKASGFAKEYYQETHRHSEKIVQPRMLHGGDLKEYQLAGLQWLVSLYNNRLNGILADEMGLGKTIQALALLAYIMEFKHNNGPFLVVVPLTTLPNWINECNKWAPGMVKVVYRGAPGVRKQIYKDEVESGQFNILFTTYEYVMKDKAMLRRVEWQYIIVDEGHRMKNAQSKFAQTLGTSYRSKHRLLLTGTPLQNNLPELWALLNFLLPTIFNSVETFDQWFNQPFASFKSQSSGGGGGDDEGDMAQLSQEERLLIVNRLHEVLRPFMLRRVKDQVLDQLPEKTETILRCDMSGWQRKLYSLIHQKTLSTVKDAVGNITNIYGSGLNNVLMQLRKVCNHPYLFLNDAWPFDGDMIRASGKFELLDRMLPKLKAAGHRVLMFSQMTQVMTILERFFELRGFPCLRLDGSTLAEERERRMVMFNDPDSPYFIFLLSTRAGGLGLNLATADVVIFFDSDWNPMMDAQAQDRAHRIGQRNEVRVFRLITTSVVEEKIIARATDKRNLTGLVVEAGKFNNRAGKEDMGDEGDRKAMMEALLKEYSEGLDIDDEGDSEETAVPDDTQINDIMACNESEFALYQKMDKQREAGRPKNTPPLIPANAMPTWAKTPDMWLNRHQQLYLMLEQADKMTAQGKKWGRLSVDGGSTPDTWADVEGDDMEEGDADGVFDDARFTEAGQKEGAGGGGNRRKRKAVSYSDGLSEAQFISLVERTGRDEDIALAARATTRKSIVGQVYGGGGAPIDAAITKKLVKLLADIMKTKTADGFKRFEIFVDKPNKKFYPDYYVIVETPIALKTIQGYLKKDRYAAVGDMVRDFDLLVGNAKIYNEEGSFVVKEALALREIFLEGVTALGLQTGGHKQQRGSDGEDNCSGDHAPLRMTLPGALFKSSG